MGGEWRGRSRGRAVDGVASELRERDRWRRRQMCERERQEERIRQGTLISSVKIYCSNLAGSARFLYIVFLKELVPFFFK
jgi:hypothetical protein